MYAILREFHKGFEYLAIVESRDQADMLAEQLDKEYESGCIVVYELKEVWRLS